MLRFATLVPAYSTMKFAAGCAAGQSSTSGKHALIALELEHIRAAERPACLIVKQVHLRQGDPIGALVRRHLLVLPQRPGFFATLETTVLAL